MADGEQQPLLRRIAKTVAVPPAVLQPGMGQLDSPVTVDDTAELPAPEFARARLDGKKRKMPQCISHRGFRAKYPENSLLAFEQAVKAGTHALETDVHLTKDDVVVISHDATLKRCFGLDDKIIDRTWDQIKDLRTTKEPHVPMPRLLDVLDYLAQPGLEDIWLLLDIKISNNTDDIMRLLGTTIAGAKPSTKPWTERIVLGIWAAKFLPLALKYLPGFPVMHIGFKLSYARHFFVVPKVGFNMLFPMLVGPGGRRFIRDCQERYHRQLIAWTVNEVDGMEWCIRRGLDGVITDDPAKFVDVCDKYDETKRVPWVPLRLKEYFELAGRWITITCLFWWFRRRFDPVASRKLIEKA